MKPLLIAAVFAQLTLSSVTHAQTEEHGYLETTAAAAREAMLSDTRDAEGLAPDQKPGESPFLSDLVKKIVLDPTTYAPAVFSFGSQRLDWSSSQVFFQHGDFERNPYYTASGRPNDVPLGYSAGNRKILVASLVTLSDSAVHGVANRLFERVLIERHPEHRKLLERLALIERIAFSSYLSYRLSAQHFSQWKLNEQVARLRY